MKLRFDYDFLSRTYRLYRIGQHNHKFDGKRIGAKWDAILDAEGTPDIDILFTRCNQPSELDRNQNDHRYDLKSNIAADAFHQNKVQSLSYK